MKHPFPFTAIVGQDEMKQAIMIAAVDPTIGGVLVFGDRGTGKSTAVRALAALLPPIKARPGCAYNSQPGDIVPGRAEDAPEGKPVEIPTPVVDLPLGATEDRVVGALDLERALASGEKVFEPGLLARAHRGFLYIDEVNLLEDHLVDLLLDVAASGENVVEREGLSIRHPARFVLVGSGNPEEGELRPQLLDRFGLSVEVGSPTEIADRVEVVKRRDAFDREPEAFLKDWAEQELDQQRAIIRARKALSRVRVPDETIEDAARLCAAVGSDGLRGELTLIRAARAFAALDGKRIAKRAHLRAIATPALRHRLRRDPLDETGSAARIARAIEETLPESSKS
ncbi:MAG: magnesium chelatase ATPase subunit I [Pseudomonadota bacterium]